MGDAIHILSIAATVLSWLSAVGHSLVLTLHRKDEVSVLTLMFNGYKYFDVDNFKASGHVYHQRMLLSIGAFIFSIPVVMLTAVMTGQFQI